MESKDCALKTNCRIVSYRLSLSNDIYFLLYLHYFLLILKFHIFFGKPTLFRVRDLEHFCDQYSFIVPTYNYLRVATTQWNLLHSFLSLILRYVFGFIPKCKIYFEKTCTFSCWGLFAIITVPLYRLLNIFEWLKYHQYHQSFWD